MYQIPFGGGEGGHFAAISFRYPLIVICALCPSILTKEKIRKCCPALVAHIVK